MTSLAHREVYEVGRYYRVLCVYWARGRDKPRWWPVLGDWHCDQALIGFEPHHIHIDTRFVHVRGSEDNVAEQLSILAQTPLQREWLFNPHRPNDDISAPTSEYRRRRCYRESYTILDSANHSRGRYGNKLPPWMKALEDHYEHVELKRPVCPHQQTPLNGPTDADGCVTCPLHGLRFRESTGRMVRHLN